MAARIEFRRRITEAVGRAPPAAVIPADLMKFLRSMSVPPRFVGPPAAGAIQGRRLPAHAVRIPDVAQPVVSRCPRPVRHGPSPPPQRRSRDKRTAEHKQTDITALILCRNLSSILAIWRSKFSYINSLAEICNSAKYLI
jgi:hypothetical protein